MGKKQPGRKGKHAPGDPVDLSGGAGGHGSTMASLDASADLSQPADRHHKASAGGGREHSASPGQSEPTSRVPGAPGEKLPRSFYESELAQLQLELVKMQYWIKGTGFRLIVIFEGRDAAGKGGTIKRITEPLNPRGCRVVALGTPSDQQRPSGISSAMWSIYPPLARS